MSKITIFSFPFFLFLVKTSMIYINNSIDDESLSNGTSDFPFKTLSSAFLMNLNTSSIDFILSPSPISYDFFNTTPTDQILNITALE